MIGQISLREGTHQDTDHVLQLWGLAYEAGSRRSKLQQDMPTLLSHRHSARLLVAEQEGRLVGTLIVTFDGWRGNMYRLAVLPDQRRRSVATRLVNEAHAWLRSQGCRRITALVEGEHEYATAFWESAGYSYDEGMRRYSKDFENGQQAKSNK
jgi:ribosomal protein S18 acetylase RimI-like enzyme